MFLETVINGALPSINSMAGTALGITDMVLGYGQSYKNYQLQKEAYEYNKSLQQQTWNREDTAVQRRMADLKAAGLSPTLAAGSAAGTSAPIKAQAPQLEIQQGAMDKYSSYLNLISQKQQNDILHSNVRTARAQAESADIDKNIKYFMLEPENFERIKQGQVNALTRDNLETELMQIRVDQERENAKILQDLGYTGKVIGILKDILGFVPK